MVGNGALSAFVLWPDRLAWPWVLLLCLLPLLLRLWRPSRIRREPALRLPWQPQLGRTSGALRLPAGRSAIALWLAWCLLCVALARPQVLGDPVEQAATARQLMLALDISASMNEPDMRLVGRRVERIVAARVVLDDFLSRRQGDHLGVIVFGQQAFVLTPLTPDLGTVRAQLADAQVGLAGDNTAIGDAIALAVKRLRGQQQGPRVLVLLTDGVNTAGSIEPLRAAELAANDAVRVHTIAFGGDGGMDFFGLRIPGQSPTLDESVLKTIAETTGGEFFRARDSDELAGIYARIEQLEPVSVQAVPLRPWRECYPFWLGLALLALLVSAATGKRQ